MQVQETIQNRISSRLDRLSPKLRRAAHYIADHPEEVAMRSLRHLARVTQLTPPTFSRTAAALGFDNYESLRDACRAQLSRQRYRYTDKARALQESEGIGADPGLFALRQSAAAIENIKLLANSIEPDELEAITRRILAARRVVLVGYLSARAIVEFMHYMASMAFDNWQVLGAGSASETAALAGLGERDIAIVVTAAPYARRTLEAARRIRDTGAGIIGITDEAISPLCAYSDTNLIVSSECPQFFPSHAATLVLIESIIGMLVAHGGPSARRGIEAVEKANHEMGEYVSARV